MSCSKLLSEMDGQGFDKNVRMAFFIIREHCACHINGQAPASLRWLAEQLDCSDKLARSILKKLATAGWIKTETKRRGYTMVQVIRHRLLDAVKDAEKDADNWLINQRDFEVVDAVKDAEKDAKGVAVDVDVLPAVGVAVIPAVSLVLQQGHAVQKEAPPPPLGKGKKKRQKDPPYFRNLKDYVTTSYATIKGCKYPFQVWELMALRRLANQYDSAQVMAWWQLSLNNEWCVNRGRNVKAFLDELPKIQDDKSAGRRAIEIRNTLALEGEWAPETEVKQQIKKANTAPPAAVQGHAAIKRAVEQHVEQESTEGELAAMHADVIRLSKTKRCSNPQECRHCKPVLVSAGAAPELDNGL